MKFNSLKSRLIIALLLIVLLPTITIGWLAHGMMSNYIMSEKITHVGRVAEAEHEQLIMALTRANSKAKLLLSDLSKQCGGNKLNHICASGLINPYLGAEGAIGANLYNNTRDDNLIIGDSAVKGKANFTFQTGQLAKFSSTGATSKHSYFISIADESFRLTITYPSSLLTPVFNPPPKDLELSGEAFLADGEGYFVTPPRYAAEQGFTLPISARPMQTCLGGQSHEALDLDYRGVAVIYGFRFVPEFGQACIMAHITQEEAFAPLKQLKKRLIIILFLFCTTLFVTIIYLARSIVKPITNLKGVTCAIAAGDYRVKAEVSGSDEIAGLATSFNLMTSRLMQSERTLKEAQQLAHLGSWAAGNAI